MCDALQGMGTTFIKLGQFLATRPDIIGEEVTDYLVRLQDKLPAFNTVVAKKIIKEELGENQFNNILNLSEPIAAASIAQVHTFSSGCATATFATMLSPVCPCVRCTCIAFGISEPA